MIKKVHRLAGRMASFLARAGEIGLPFYRILRHLSKFEWIADASKDFQKLKAYLPSPPLLDTPIADETL